MSQLKTLLCGTLICSLTSAAVADDFGQPQAIAALRKSVNFYRSQVSYQGAYLYQYSADLTKQEGEHEAHRTTGWTQPPGTPTVGSTYLAAHILTGEQFLLDAAKEVAESLLLGQLESGCWYYKFELAPEDRVAYAYRLAPNNPRGRNDSTLDDNKSQSALLFLMHLDEELAHADRRINEAVRYGLTKVVAAQFPNGAWPQQFTGPPDPAKHPVVKASFPPDWSRTYSQTDYRLLYTLNDNSLADTIDVMLEAARIYDEPAYRRAAERGGDFVILAQLPAPQAGWAQQYDAQMQPSWARKFEPPAVTGGESQGAMQSLLRLYDETGNKKYLAPLPSAISYYRRSLLADGRLARFYEMGTNNPLFFTKEYLLTYSDADMPTHYSFKVSSKLAAIERDFQRQRDRGPTLRRPDWRPSRRARDESLRRAAEEVAASADSRGAWLETGRLRTYSARENVTSVITMPTYVRNLMTLSRYAAAR